MLDLTKFSCRCDSRLYHYSLALAQMASPNALFHSDICNRDQTKHQMARRAANVATTNFQVGMHNEFGFDQRKTCAF